MELSETRHVQSGDVADPHGGRLLLEISSLSDSYHVAHWAGARRVL